ncbi:MAG TPA: Uma2 family endonuclease [Leptospiraceae bacterium]|nr:Uma2 family endonuclease [Leptospiraceae bacterium]HMW05985.1 Uma2 family endonuclease [Leptospiraceae bacterium]HMX32083.1 Uma2 family endonuclease [Leptospiraceae bacterium]HMY32339.1 Uma2 family endonuclease [Leptospiraceae bacterium]HMZ62459.1 Uma2 family endonuclease [Leptospiraceae bacterium]
MIVYDFGAEKKESTYADYLKTPEGGKFQLIGGEIIEITSPSLYHQDILLNLSSLFRNFLLKNKIGKVFVSPLDVMLSEKDVYQPDIRILLNESFPKMKENKIEGTPDLVVEILSPSTAYYDLKQKKTTYEKSGVREYWVVDPIQKTVELFENQNGKFISFAEHSKTEIAKSRLVAGMEIELEQVF